MEKETLFAIISIIIYLVGIIPYWRDVIIGRTYPHPFSTGVWSILVWFNTYVLYMSGEYLAFLPSLVMTFSLIFFWVGYGIKQFRKIHINWFDYLCLWLSGILILYWFLSGNILNTVILTMIIDFVAFLPVFKKWYLHPWTETIWATLLAGVNQIFTLLAITSPNPETTLFWGYLFFANLLFFFMVFFRRWYLRWWHSIFE